MQCKTTRWILLGLIVLAGLLVRVWPIAQYPLWFDEADTWRSAIHGEEGKHPKGIQYVHFFTWKVHFETPPLTFLLSRLSADVFDTPVVDANGSISQWRPEPWKLRLPAMLLGVVMIPLVYWLGRIAVNDTLGLLAALIVAFDPNMVDQSQQARMYTLLAFLMIASLTWAIVLIRDPDRGWWQWLGMGLTLGLAMWTLQFALIAWVGIAGAVALMFVAGYVIGQPHPRSMKMLLGTFVAFVFAMIVAAQGIYGIFARMGERGDSEHLTLVAIVRDITVYAKDLIQFPPIVVAGRDLSVLGLLMYPLALLGIILLFKRCKTSAAVLLCVAAANIAILIPFRRMHHFMDPRYLTGIQPMFWIGLAMLAVGFQRKPLRVAGLALVLVYVGVQAWQVTHLGQWYQQPDKYQLAPMIERVRDQKQPGEALVYHPQVVEVLGNYYHLPRQPEMDAIFYDDFQLKKQIIVPATFDAPSTWLVIGMVNYDGRVTSARQVISALAKHYGVTIDPAELNKHVQVNRVVAARFSAEGVQWMSKGPGE